MVLKKVANSLSGVSKASSSTASTVSTPETRSLRSSTDAKSLPYRIKGETAALTVHSVAEQDGIIVSITPPMQPAQSINHMPCDIVLVIDVSGSMDDAAPVPGDESKPEENGLSILDLTKHAARTILHTLNRYDRLAIVTFSSEADVLLPLLPMTEENKRAADAKITSMKPLSATNLWHGITTGIKLFDGNSRAESVSAIMVLTDGQPNHMCPAQGYVPKLRSMHIPATIHTFGFGYSIRSGLLKAIAEIGGGSYAFIPDAGMIGTVFVHAVANLQSTFAMNAVLTLKSQVPLMEVMGKSVKQEKPVMIASDGSEQLTTIHLGSIQYGQSRDIFIEFDESSSSSESEMELSHGTLVEAQLHYTSMIGGGLNSNTLHDLSSDPDLANEKVAYHRTRAQICSLLSSLFKAKTDGEYTAGTKVPKEASATLGKLIESVTALEMGTALEPLLADLTGQISIALSQDMYYRKWGRHYLPSLLSSHTSQSCNSFKDPGPLEYGKDSPLFVQCRDALDSAFDSLPPPKPSRVVQKGKSSHGVSMRHYNRSSNPCFAGGCKVLLSSGREIALRKLRAGMSVSTPLGARKVAAVLKTRIVNDETETEMCWIGDKLLVTPYHPISLDRGQTWVFPIDVASTVITIARTLSVYSVLLQPDNDDRAHGIYIGGCLGVTLGHGMVKGRRDDVRSHAFFGDYERVSRSLRYLRKNKNGVTIGRGVRRHEKSGLVIGFRPSVRTRRKR